MGSLTAMVELHRLFMSIEKLSGASKAFVGHIICTKHRNKLLPEAFISYMGAIICA